MSLVRNLFEAHADANTMFRDFRRPIPRRPASKKPIGEWGHMLRLQTYISTVICGGIVSFTTRDFFLGCQVD